MKKGVALLWVLVLSTVLMIISGTMVNTIIKESRFSVSIEDSVKAYAAAKTGIDWGTAELADEKSTVTDKIITIEKNAAGVPIVTATVKIDRTTKIVTSTGKSGFVRRRLEYHSTTDLGTKITPINPPHDTPVGPLNESFTLQFDFWGKPDSSRRVNFGLHDTSTTAQISLQIGLDNKLNLRFLNLNTGELLYYPVVTDPINQTPFLWSSAADPYQYRATIKYVKDTSVVLTLRQREEYVDAEGISRVRYGCIAEATADLSTTSMNIGTHNSLLTFGTSPTTHSYIAADTDYSDPYLGDGEYLEFVTSATTFIRIDNIIFKGRVGGATTFNVSAVASPSGGGSVSGTGTFVTGQNTTLTATAAAGYAFSSWSGDCTGTNSSFAINNIAKNWSCIANFTSTVPKSTSIEAIQVTGECETVTYFTYKINHTGFGGTNTVKVYYKDATGAYVLRETFYNIPSGTVKRAHWLYTYKEYLGRHYDEYFWNIYITVDDGGGSPVQSNYLELYDFQNDDWC